MSFVPFSCRVFGEWEGALERVFLVAFEINSVHLVCVCYYLVVRNTLSGDELSSTSQSQCLTSGKFFGKTEKIVKFLTVRITKM